VSGPALPYSSGNPTSPVRASELPLSRHGLDRDYLARARPTLFDELAADPGTRFLLMWHGNGLLASAAGTRLALVTADAVPAQGLWLYLGRTLTATDGEPAGTAIVAVVLADEAAESVSADRQLWGNLRTVGGSLSDRDAGMLTEALALANWHDSHRFSPRTGGPLVPELGGWVRRSEDDETAIFPRTDPAIIVLITDADDRILLGSNALWESNRYSLLAGFVEPGESLEAAVIREVFEESGIRVVNPVYFGSQPWPFPASLMVGFRALADPHSPWTQSPDGAEILDLRWFSRGELGNALGEIVLPGRTSIARYMIEDWFGGPIEAT
jgi:NTP pyrophosphohydrolases containing a Zn-finger, probably nucleic-acid-binding